MKILLFVLFLVGIALLQGCMRMRTSDAKARALFAKKKVPLEIRDTLIAGRHLHFAMTSHNNSLPTLVFVHGSPGSWFHYQKFMLDEDLRKKFQLVCIDRPGFGHSDFGKALHLNEQSELIASVLKSLKTEKPMYLCGHSMGGPVVVKLAADHPDLFKTIVIVAGAIDVEQEKKERWRYLMENPALRWLLPGAFRPSNTELLYLKKDLIPLQKDFANIRCDVHFVHGDRDTWVPIENVDFGKKMMVNARSIRSDTLHGADHQVPWKRFEELKTILMELE
jgi:pimeloyl-ACP methyl ester carboxylesterase